MTKLKLNLAYEAGEILSREELKHVLGGTGSGSGSGSGNECSNLSQDKCSGSCKIDGVEGKCGWTKVPTGRCTCAVITFV